MSDKEYRATKESPYHITSGGVVYMVDGNYEIKILLLYRVLSNGRKSYHLPKGTLHHNETLEKCAARETEEESGSLVHVGNYLGSVNSVFIHPQSGLETDKVSHYFALRHTATVRPHDNEHDGREWLSLEKAKNCLFDTEPLKREYEIVDRFRKSYQMGRR